MRIFSALAIILLFSITPIFGQEAGFDPNSSIQNISIAQWTDEDGLSSNNITKVFQDSKGLMWLTSFNGVMIFDGERIDLYDINNLEVLETDGFYTVVENSQGTIFLGSQGSGIIQYEDGEFSRVGESNSVLPKSIPTLFISKDESLYVGSNNQGLFKIQGDSYSKIEIEGLNKSTITSITEDVEGNLWVATEGQGLFGIKNEELLYRFTTENGLLDNYIENIVTTQEGKLMIASTEGLQYIDDSGELFIISEFQGIYINYLLVDEWNSVWVGSENGLARWNQKLNKTDWIYGKRGIDLVRISSLMKDVENSLWVTSSRTGLIRLKESMLNNWTDSNLSSNRVNIVHESWDGNFYIGTDKNQIDVRSDNRYSIIKIKTDLGGNGVRDIYHEKDGSFWLATYVGIIYKKGDQEILYSTESGMPANNFRTINKSQNGDLWFGSRAGGLVRFKDGNVVEILDNKNKLESNFVLSVTVSDDGKLFVGTHSGGMTVLYPDGTSKNYHLKDDDSGVLIFNIDLLSSSTALLTANVGLIYFNGDSLSLVRLVADRKSKTYFDLVADQREDYWMTTNMGIMKIKKSHLQLYIDAKIAEVPYQLLDENNGMNNRECTGATRSILSSDGKVLVPTLGGVCEISPELFSLEHSTPKVQIRSVQVDDDRFSSSNEEVIISAGAMRYEFEFAVLSFTAVERNKFKYQLQGFEEEWSEIDYEGQVEYTNLPPGKYVFRVIGSNEGNNWNMEGASFSFRVLPFYYETIWFYLLIFILVILIFLTIYKWRIALINEQNVALKKVNTELDRFVYSASHEIRSPLSSILGLINLARMGNPENRLEYFDQIEKSVNRLDDFIHDIVDYSRNARLGVDIEKIDFSLIISNILEDISHTKNFDKIRCDLSYNNDVKFYSDSRRLKVVLSNIITNAFKHHSPEKVEEPFVSIRISDIPNGIEIQVKDNGPGIEESHQAKVFNMFYRATSRSEGSGLGLYIVEETLEKLQGSIAIESKLDEGSSFTIKIKNMNVLLPKNNE